VSIAPRHTTLPGCPGAQARSHLLAMPERRVGAHGFREMRSSTATALMRTSSEVDDARLIGGSFRGGVGPRRTTRPFNRAHRAPPPTASRRRRARRSARDRTRRVGDDDVEPSRACSPSRRPAVAAPSWPVDRRSARHRRRPAAAIQLASAAPSRLRSYRRSAYRHRGSSAIRALGCCVLAEARG